jgi:hypothetical protein
MPPTQEPVVHVSPAQHASPAPPHAMHIPPEQSPVVQMSPAQQAMPTVPQVRPESGTPLSTGGTPVSSGGTPVSPGGTPVSPGGTPVSPGGTPVSLRIVPPSMPPLSSPGSTVDSGQPASTNGMKATRIESLA